MNDTYIAQLEKFYFFLREMGFSSQSQVIKKLIYHLRIGDAKGFRTACRSSLIWGGPGSIVDIYLQDIDKQKELESYLKQLKQIKNGICI